VGGVAAIDRPAALLLASALAQLPWGGTPATGRTGVGRVALILGDAAPEIGCALI